MDQVSDKELLLAQQKIVELEASKADLKDFIENGTAGLHWVDKHGIIIWANQSELEMLGYNYDEYIGQHISNFYARQDVIQDILQRLSNDETLVNYEAEMLCKDGAVKTMLISSNVLRKEGEFIHTRCFTRDITQYKKSQIEINAWKNRYEAVIKASGQLMYERDVPTNTLLYGGDVNKFLGYSLEEMQGGLDLWKSLVHPDDLEKFEQALKNLTPDTNEVYIEYRVRKKDGQYIYVEDKAYPHFDKGNLSKVTGILIDCTQRLSIERQLREQTEIVKVINQLGQVLAAQLDLDKLLQALTDVATELIRAKFGSFFYNVVNDKGESYQLYTLSGVDKEHFAHFPMPRNTEVFAPTFRGEGIVRSDDIRKDPRYGKNLPYAGIPKGHLPVVSYLALPVTSRSGEVLGGLFFGHPEPGIFTARDEQTLAGVAAQAAIAIDNARLYKQAREAVRVRDKFLAAAHRRTEILTRQKQILESVAKGEVLQGSLTKLVRLIEELTNNELVVSIQIADKARQNLKLIAAPSLPEAFGKAIDDIGIRADNSFWGLAAYKKERVSVPDIVRHPLWQNYQELAAQYELRACWATPILNTFGQLLGIFAIYYREPRHPQIEEIEVIELVASTAATIIEYHFIEEERKHLLEQTEQANKTKDETIAQLEKAQQELVRMAAIVESSHDPIMSQSLEGIIQSWNKSAERLYGYSSKEVCGRHISMLFASEYTNDIPKLLMPLDRGEIVNDFETINVAKGGNLLQVSLTAFPVNNNGEIVSSSIIVRDLTERKYIERERAKLLQSDH